MPPIKSKLLSDLVALMLGTTVVSGSSASNMVDVSSPHLKTPV